MGLRLEYSDNREAFRYVNIPFVEKNERGKSMIETPTDYVIIDTETTGLDNDFCELIEVAAIKVVNSKVVDTFQSLIKPMKHFEYSGDYAENEFVPLSAVTGSYYVDSFISSFTGITNEMLETAPDPVEVLKKFYDFIGDNVLVGYSVSFDINFLYTAFVRHLNLPLRNNYIDLLRFSRKLFPNEERHRLQDTARLCNVIYMNAHRAMGDCEITLGCYQHMIGEITAKYESFDVFKSWFANNGSIDVKSITSSVKDFDEEHLFYKKTIVFTGALNIPRREAMQKVVDVGGLIGNSVTKKTDFLVIGTLDFERCITSEKSSKIVKAEKLKSEGVDINIISENIFNEMLSNK